MKKYAIAAAVSLTLAAFGQGAAFEPAMKGEVLIAGKSTVRVEKRIARDLPIRRDMTVVKFFCFDMRISNPADFASYICYFKSGGGRGTRLLHVPPGGDGHPPHRVLGRLEASRERQHGPPHLD